MNLNIHAVGHGMCISLIHDNGNVMLWDCGHSEEARPSAFLRGLGVRQIDEFFITNYDQDHLSDLPNLRATFGIRSLFRNTSINAAQLRELKRQGGPISLAMESMLDMMNTYNGGPLAPPPAFPGVTKKIFWNNYSTNFPNTNDISLVTFLDINGTKFLIPGDLENAGWRGLMSSEEFVIELRGVNYFVASHHGRESGYVADVMDIARPHAVIFSDGPVIYATQEMAACYGNHCVGVQFNGEARSVLSTRCDGTISWNFQAPASVLGARF